MQPVVLESMLKAISLFPKTNNSIFALNTLHHKCIRPWLLTYRWQKWALCCVLTVLLKQCRKEILRNLRYYININCLCQSSCINLGLTCLRQMCMNHCTDVCSNLTKRHMYSYPNSLCVTSFIYFYKNLSERKITEGCLILPAVLLRHNERHN